MLLPLLRRRYYLILGYYLIALWQSQLSSLNKTETFNEQPLYSRCLYHVLKYHLQILPQFRWYLKSIDPNTSLNVHQIQSSDSPSQSIVKHSLRVSPGKVVAMRSHKPAGLLWKSSAPRLSLVSLSRSWEELVSSVLFSGAGECCFSRSCMSFAFAFFFFPNDIPFRTGK